MTFTYILPPVPTASAVVGPAVGQIYYDAVSNQMKMYDGQNWVALVNNTSFFDERVTVVCTDVVQNGVTWYTVESSGGIFSTRQRWWQEAIDYARATFKNEASAWDLEGDWLANNSRFWFKKERDRTLFVLRMSCIQ